MSTSTPIRYGPAQRRLLDQLIRERLQEDRYELFFVGGEGVFFPAPDPREEIEETSGYVLDAHGRVFYFEMGWDSRTEAGALTAWEEIEPEPGWIQSAEYRRARERMGLPV